MITNIKGTKNLWNELTPAHVVWLRSLRNIRSKMKQSVDKNFQTFESLADRFFAVRNPEEVAQERKEIE